MVSSGLTLKLSCAKTEKEILQIRTEYQGMGTQDPGVGVGYLEGIVCLSIDGDGNTETCAVGSGKVHRRHTGVLRSGGNDAQSPSVKTET